MILRDLTADVVYESVQRYMDLQNEREKNDMILAGQLYDNTTAPNLPNTMKKALREEYLDEWTPIALGRLIPQKISNSMYGRDVERTTGNAELDKEWAQLFKKISMQAPVACRACSAYGDAAIRVVRNYKGLVLTLYTGKQIHPIYDPEAPDDQPLGMIYEYKCEMPDDQIIAKLNGKAAKSINIVEVITRHQRDLDGNIVIPGIRAKFVEGERVYYDDNDPGLNPYGDFLDCSYWRNSQEIHSHRGESDIIPLNKLLQRINHVVTDSDVFLKWNQWPILWTTAEDDKKNPMQYSWRNLLFLGETSDGGSASMGKIDMDAKQITGYIEFVQSLVQMVSISSRVPSVSLGDTKNLGQLSSGRAYEIAMTPLVDMISERTPLFQFQEVDLMAVCLAVQAVHNKMSDMLDAKITEDGVTWETPDYKKVMEYLVDASVEFGQMNMAKSQLEDTQVHSIRIGVGYESPETAIRMTHPQWSDIQVDEELKRIGAGGVETLDASAKAKVDTMREALQIENIEEENATESE